MIEPPKLVVIPTTLEEANEFVIAFHRLNDALVGARFSIGASFGGQLVGVAIVVHPVSSVLGDVFTAEVRRPCTREEAPKGTVKFLSRACWRIWRAMGGFRMVYD